jgi:hypothetical protein
MNISRRAVLGGIGHSAALGTMATSLRAAQPTAAATTYCLSMVYTRVEGATFNGEMFRSKHLPLMKKVYGSAVERIELRMPTPLAEGAPAPKIIATVNTWFSDVAEFSRRNGKAAKDVTASIAKVTSAPLTGQVDQVLAVLGDARSTVPIGNLCLSTYFPAEEGGIIHADYFAETLYPKMAEMYGPDAIRRIEVTKGVAGASGGKASLLVSAHVYIRDNDSFNAAAAKSGNELYTDVEEYTNITPVQTLTRLQAIG